MMNTHVYTLEVTNLKSNPAGAKEGIIQETLVSTMAADSKDISIYGNE